MFSWLTSSRVRLDVANIRWLEDRKMKIFKGVKANFITVFVEKNLEKVHFKLSDETMRFDFGAGLFKGTKSCSKVILCMTNRDFQRRTWSCSSQATPAAGRWRFSCTPPAAPLGLCAGGESAGAKPCTKEGSKMGVPPGWRGVRRPVRGGAGAWRRDAGPALLPSEAVRLVPALRRRQLVVPYLPVGPV